MKGVNRADQNISLYNTSIEGIKWYFSLKSHCFDMAERWRTEWPFVFQTRCCSIHIRNVQKNIINRTKSSIFKLVRNMISLIPWWIMFELKIWIYYVLNICFPPTSFGDIFVKIGSNVIQSGSFTLILKHVIYIKWPDKFINSKPTLR